MVLQCFVPTLLFSCNFKRKWSPNDCFSSISTLVFAPQRPYKNNFFCVPGFLLTPLGQSGSILGNKRFPSLSPSSPWRRATSATTPAMWRIATDADRPTSSSPRKVRAGEDEQTWILKFQLSKGEAFKVAQPVASLIFEIFHYQRPSLLQ